MARILRIEACGECPHFRFVREFYDRDSYATCDLQEGMAYVDRRGIDVDANCPLPEEEQREL